jgi:hypothetical protein
MKTYFAICILLTLSATQLYADNVTSPAPSSAQSEDLKNCAFVTHNCELCVLDDNGKVVCSSVGTACVPKVKRCLVKKPG